MAASTQSSLFKLPIELRFEIHNHAFTHVVVDYETRGSVSIEIPAILATSRQIREEAFEFFLTRLKARATSLKRSGDAFVAKSRQVPAKRLKLRLRGHELLERAESL